MSVRCFHPSKGSTYVMTLKSAVLFAVLFAFPSLKGFDLRHDA